jgi:signal transduction histidine kinase
VTRPTSQSDATSDAFIRHVAHDLRASLNAVVGWAELVKGGLLPPEELQRAGDTIVRHSRHLSQRLGDALDLWRLDLGLFVVSPRPSVVSSAVRSAVDAARPQFESRRVECALDVHDDGVADVDGPRLVQALVVLLADAAANTPAGQRVDVNLAIEEANLVVRIVGGGRLPGAGAFDRNPSDTRPQSAVRPFDFGLSLAKTLVMLNGGSIEAEPAEGNRVAFILRVPRTADGPTASTSIAEIEAQGQS